MKHFEALEKPDAEMNGYVNYVFDLVKLILYSVYYFWQQIIDFMTLFKNIRNTVVSDKGFNMTGGDLFLMVWNTMISVLNIGNFFFFVLLSSTYDVNTILNDYTYIDHANISSYYF